VRLVLWSISVRKINNLLLFRFNICKLYRSILFTSKKEPPEKEKGDEDKM
jgi:hypothetical protein